LKKLSNVALSYATVSFIVCSEEDAIKKMNLILDSQSFSDDIFLYSILF